MTLVEDAWSQLKSHRMCELIKNHLAAMSFSKKPELIVTKLNKIVNAGEKSSDESLRDRVIWVCFTVNDRWSSGIPIQDPLLPPVNSQSDFEEFSVLCRSFWSSTGTRAAATCRLNSPRMHPQSCQTNLRDLIPFRLQLNRLAKLPALLTSFHQIVEGQLLIRLLQTQKKKKMFYQLVGKSRRMRLFRLRF